MNSSIEVDTGNDSDEMLNSALVAAVAKRFLNRGVEYDELFQAGYVGLLLARRGFDVNRGVPFPAYAFPFIEGEIRSFLRNNRNIRLPRSALNMILQSENHYDVYERKCEEEEANGATEVNVRSNDRIKDVLLQFSTFATIPFSQIEEKNAESVHEQMSIPGFENDLIVNMDLKNGVGRLNDLEKKIIKLRYIDNKSQLESGKILGIGQSTISRHEKSALRKLRASI